MQLSYPPKFSQQSKRFRAMLFWRDESKTKQNKTKQNKTNKQRKKLMTGGGGGGGI